MSLPHRGDQPAMGVTRKPYDLPAPRFRAVTLVDQSR